MVNEKNGKTYRPEPIYNRKMLRNIIRERAIEINGYHNVNRYVKEAFKKIRKEMIEAEEE